MKLAFSGTRHGLSAYQRERLEDLLTSPFFKDVDEIHHGDCVGADADFHAICTRLELQHLITIHPPTDNTLRAYCAAPVIRPPKEYLVRNLYFLKRSTILIAAPHTMEQQVRSGTWWCVRKAQELDIPVCIVYPRRVEFDDTGGLRPRI